MKLSIKVQGIEVKGDENGMTGSVESVAVETSPSWLSSKFYPVDYGAKVIYNDPQPRECDCSFGKYDVMKDGTVGRLGSRLNKYQSNYSAFTIRPPK